jgi:pimeloyl-ACP methyl ester carboxylesterase
MTTTIQPERSGDISIQMRQALRPKAQPMTSRHKQVLDAAWPRARPEYERYVKIQYGWSLSGNWPHAAMVRALAQTMVYEDPVVYDWQHIKVKTLQLGGAVDGPDFPARAKFICDTIPDCELALIPGIGHVPHFEAPELFYKELLKFLKSERSVTAQ